MEAEIREKIIEAATQLLARYGYRKMTVEDIAKEAGISHSTIYKYFKGKDEIVGEVAIREAMATGEQIDKIIQENVPGLKKLEKVILFIVDRILANKNMYKITTSDFLELYPIIERIITNEEQRARERLKKIILQIQKEYNAKFNPDKLTESLFFIITSINNLLIIKNFNREEVLKYFETLFRAFEEIEKGEVQDEETK